VFTLERLTSIFAQIASTGDAARMGGGARAAAAFGTSRALQDSGHHTAEQISSTYGDADLFTSVSE
jgi:hypothetical protein